MVVIAMWYSPGRYPGWSCSARSASRKASPWPGLTRKNRLNSLVEPTLTPGRDAPVAGSAMLPPLDLRLPSLAALGRHHGLRPDENPHSIRMRSHWMALRAGDPTTVEPEQARCLP